MTTIRLEDKERAFQTLRETKALFAARGWFPATSGNLSVRVGEYAPDRFAFAITSSGRDKSVMTPEDFLLVDQNGKPIEETGLKPSAETLIHCEIYRLTGCGAIFHVHTVFNNLVSELYKERGGVPIKGVELIKAFNIWEEDAAIEVPILPNYADIPRIARLVKARIVERVPGILLLNHGIYAWGATHSRRSGISRRSSFFSNTSTGLLKCGADRNGFGTTRFRRSSGERGRLRRPGARTGAKTAPGGPGGTINRWG